MTDIELFYDYFIFFWWYHVAAEMFLRPYKIQLECLCEVYVFQEAFLIDKTPVVLWVYAFIQTCSSVIFTIILTAFQLKDYLSTFRFINFFWKYYLNCVLQFSTLIFNLYVMYLVVRKYLRKQRNTSI